MGSNTYSIENRNVIHPRCIILTWNEWFSNEKRQVLGKTVGHMRNKYSLGYTVTHLSGFGLNTRKQNRTELLKIFWRNSVAIKDVKELPIFNLIRSAPKQFQNSKSSRRNFYPDPIRGLPDQILSFVATSVTDGSLQTKRRDYDNLTYIVYFNR